jgi:hypothetical protein
LTTTTGSTDQKAANDGDTDYFGGSGRGGESATEGKDGVVVIIYEVNASPAKSYGFIIG